jgi:N-acetyl-1-D-myo-inositol-2-amino-2-deoxy-alpha-D-glucopyranoside deacetylase
VQPGCPGKLSLMLRASVLAVYAHPDDELFHGGGMLAHLADRGVRVTIACATRGEAGRAHPSVGPVADVGAHRTAELQRSCEILGFDAPRFLGFHDSARKDRLRRDDPRALANVDMLDVEAAILRVIRDVEPHIVVTFDPHGGYYHPDHVAVHRAATAAFFSSGAIGAAAPVRLFYSTFAVGIFREHAARTDGWGIVDGLDPEIFAVSDGTIAVTFDARPLMDRKLAAFAAHQSAFGVSAAMLREPPPEQARRLHAFAPIMEREDFTLAATRGAVAHWPLADLLDGLRIEAV